MSRITYQPKNFVSTGLEDLPADQHRSYLSVVAVTPVIVTLQKPDGTDMTPFIIQEGHHWAPIPAPTNPIKFEGVGTIIRG